MIHIADDRTGVYCSSDSGERACRPCHGNKDIDTASLLVDKGSTISAASMHNVTNFAATWRTCAALLGIVLALGLAGCAGDMSDLERYAREVKARPGGRIEPIPELRPYRSFAYPGHDRNPFDASIFAMRIVEDDPLGITSTVRPDLYRPREFLESFPLDTLRMVGTLMRDEDFYVLIRTPERSIQRVTMGNYMGQNHGRIVSIAQTGLELVEIVPDGYGGYMERETAIALSE